jgi:hypothetical protein
MKRLLLLTILVIFALAACGGDNESPPSQLDAPFEDSSLPLPGTTVAPVATVTPWPTPWTTTAAPSGPTITPRPSVTAVPTRDRTTGTEEPIDNSMVPGDWLSQPFTDAAGNERTLAEFAGRAVVIHLLSASCDLCIEQERILMQAVQDRYDIDQLSDTVFLALGVLERETPSMIQAVLQQQLADSWSTVELLQRDDVPADWLAGIASPELLDALERDFGPEVRDPDGLVIIVIEPDGYAHLTPPGLVNFTTLRDAITFYSNPVE